MRRLAASREPGFATYRNLKVGSRFTQGRALERGLKEAAMHPLNDNKDDLFISRLVAIAESHEPENERIERAIDLCASHLVDIKKSHGIDPHEKPTSGTIAQVANEIASLRDRVRKREDATPSNSVVARVLKAARSAIEVETRGNDTMREILKEELLQDPR
jgi:hypothetical protein